MDAAGIDMQVLSLTSPGSNSSKAMRQSQSPRLERFSRGCGQAQPHAISAFATLPTALPGKAVEELERTVREYGLKER